LKLETVGHAFFVLAILVPGFVLHSVRRAFIVGGNEPGKEFALLKLATLSAVNYAVCSPAIYYLTQTTVRPLVGAVMWAGVIFVSPVLLGLLNVVSVQRRWVRRLAAWCGCPPLIHAVPTAWDWRFSQASEGFVLVTLTDGSTVGGLYGSNSMASSESGDRDLYLEKLYRIPAEGDWQPAENDEGIYIPSSQIKFLEFRKPTP
jgi:hypothetical protein